VSVRPSVFLDLHL